MRGDNYQIGEEKVAAALFTTYAEFHNELERPDDGVRYGEMAAYIADLLTRDQVREALVQELKYDRDNDRLAEYFTAFAEGPKAP